MNTRSGTIRIGGYIIANLHKTWRIYRCSYDTSASHFNSFAYVVLSLPQMDSDTSGHSVGQTHRSVLKSAPYFAVNVMAYIARTSCGHSDELRLLTGRHSHLTLVVISHTIRPYNQCFKWESNHNSRQFGTNRCTDRKYIPQTGDSIYGWNKMKCFY